MDGQGNLFFQLQLLLFYHTSKMLESCNGMGPQAKGALFFVRLQLPGGMGEVRKKGLRIKRLTEWSVFDKLYLCW
jgi:hypothetical protein